MENNNEVNQDEMLVDAKVVKHTKAVRNNAIALSTVFGLAAIGGLIASAVYSANVLYQNLGGIAFLATSWLATYYGYEAKEQQMNLNAMNPVLSRKQ